MGIKNHGKIRENDEKRMEKSWKNRGKNHGKMMRKIWDYWGIWKYGKYGKYGEYGELWNYEN